MTSQDTAALIEQGLKAVEVKLDGALAKHEGQIRESGEASARVTAEVKALAEEHKRFADEQKKLSDALVSIQQKGVKIDHVEAGKSIGEQFIESKSFLDYKSGASTRARLEVKNTITGESGSPQEPSNTIVPLQTMSGIIGGAFRALRVLDIIPRGVATGNQIHVPKELAYTNNAAERQEGTQKPESSLTFTSVDVPVRTIAHFLKVSKQVMDDAPALQSYIDRRLGHGVRQRLEYQIINGNGTSPNISGILDSGNYTTLTAGSNDTRLDFANRAKYAVESADYQADVILVNPTDWGKIERTKSTDGEYVGGQGVVNYINNGLTPVLFGLPVITSNNVPAGTLICMATDAVMFWERQSTVIEIFDQNDTDVEKNLLTIRAEMRGAFSVFRPAAVVAGTLPSI